jgi:hypothetical protein
VNLGPWWRWAQLAVIGLFGLLAAYGVVGVRAFGLPWIIAGLAGALGTAAVMRWSSRAPRIAMLVAAVAVVAIGVAVAPAGMERSFTITVNTILAVLLALYALVLPGRSEVRGGAQVP